MKSKRDCRKNKIIITGFKNMRNKNNVKPFGNCPVQAEGILPAGEYYYFRARYNTVSLDIAKTSSLWAKGKLLWTISGDYGKTPYAAGWMPEEKAIKLANRMIGKYLRIKIDINNKENRF